MPAFCIVSRLISFAIADNAFRRQYTSPEEIFALKISPQKDSLQVRFREEMLCRPIFRDIKNVASGSIVSATKALPYSKCRDHFVWLGRVAGFEQPLELYQLRRASGRKMNSKFFVPCGSYLDTNLLRCSYNRRTQPGNGTSR
jgi:hypothetical protein